MPKNSYIFTVKEKHNEATLRSIAQKGLFIAPDDENRVYSYDGERSHRICYFYVPRPVARSAPKTRQDFLFRTIELGLGHLDYPPLKGLQHKEIDGLWTLLLEREYITTQPMLETNADRFEWEDRLENSVLLVLNCPAARLARDQGILNIPAEIQDMQTEQAFTSAEIQMVLCPIDQLALVKKSFPSHQVCPVDSVIHSVNCGSNKIEQHTEFLQGPDYAKKLQELIDVGKLNYPFALHIVRLASSRDFLKIPALQQKLSMADCRKYFKAQDPSLILRRAAAFGIREDVEYILPNADINSQTISKGQTALDLAIEQQSVPIIKTLLKAGAKTDIPDLSGNTARQLADQANINLDDIRSGAYDKQVFQKRALAELKTAALPPEIRSLVGRCYQPPM